MKNALLFASLAVTGLGLPSEQSNVVHEKRNVLNPSILKREAANGNMNLDLRIALKQTNTEKAAQRLMEISDPHSGDYGKHLSHKEVVDMFASDDKSIASIKSWLTKSGVADKDIILSKTKNWITVKTTVNKAEKILSTRYHMYENRAVGSELIGTDEYSLPNEISDLVDYVVPAASLSKVKRATKPGQKKSSITIREPFRSLSQAQIDKIKANSGGALANCDTVITPQCIKAIYKIPEPTSSNITNPMGLFESIDDVYSQEDLDKFFELAAPNIPAGTGPNLDLINGATAPNAPDEAGGESDLDFDMAYPIIYPQQITLFQVKATSDDDDVFGDFLSAIDPDYCKIDGLGPNKMCGTFDTTNVISISYGEAEDVSNVKGEKRLCDEFLKMSLIGVTTVVASGDSGVADRGNYCWGPHHDIFVSDELSSCPYVLSVGSTTLPEGSKVGDPEVATTSFSSGGGFSNIHLRPDWQNNAVGTYLLRHNPNYFAYNTSDGVIPPSSGKYNRGGRAYPDVSALGDNGLVVNNLEVGLSGGTSMSTPIVAAIITRINEERLSLGKGPVGWINPALYQAYDKKIPGFFNDVTVGNQRLGGVASDRGLSSCGNIGFSAVQGYDPVSGLGTPNYPVWLKYFVKL